MKALKIAGLSLSAIIGILILTIQVSTYHPEPLEEMKVHCSEDAPELQPGQKIKVLNWNVQYLAGKKYVFWYDTSDGSGKDIRPETAEIKKTLQELLRVLKDEKPDIVLLQEVNVDAKNTDYMDQVQAIVSGLPDEYNCYTSAYYWKADFVPDPNVMGSVGMKLLTISRYKIDSARRHQLSLMPMDIISSQFYLKRAVLEATLPVTDRPPLVAMNTHLDAFAQGTNVMQDQVAEVAEILKANSEEGQEWIIGGDFNLLPPGWDRSQLHKNDQLFYQEDSEISVLFSEFQSSVSEEELNGPGQANFYTHFPNSYVVDAPDRTIDYIFYSEGLKQNSYRVRSEDTKNISDHLPMIGEYTLPE